MTSPWAVSGSRRGRRAERCDVSAARVHAPDGADRLGKGRDGRNGGLDLNERGGVASFVATGFPARARKNRQDESSDPFHLACTGRVYNRKVAVAIQASARSSMYCERISRALRCASSTAGNPWAPSLYAVNDIAAIRLALST